MKLFRDLKKFVDVLGKVDSQKCFLAATGALAAKLLVYLAVYAASYSISTRLLNSTERWLIVTALGLYLVSHMLSSIVKVISSRHF